jgi:hypothetical protein
VGYHISRFFTFVFFVPQILGNSLDTFNKSCSALLLESIKSEFAIFWFFYGFLEILQESAKSFHY